MDGDSSLNENKIAKSHFAINCEDFVSLQQDISNDSESSHVWGADTFHQTINDFVIPQLDGGIDSESSLEEDTIVKNVFSINCEVKEITLLINFFRSNQFLWNSLQSHSLCTFDQHQKEHNCFLCHLRSSCLRLNSERTLGPKGLKVVEFASQLPQYEVHGWNWKENISNIVHFI